jgi:hypothetical protein
MQPIKAQLTIFKEEPKAKRSYTKRAKNEPTLFEIDHMTMNQLTGKVQKLDHLTPPFFEDATDIEPKQSPFKKRLLALWKAGK